MRVHGFRSRRADGDLFRSGREPGGRHAEQGALLLVGCHCLLTWPDKPRRKSVFTPWQESLASRLGQFCVCSAASTRNLIRTLRTGEKSGIEVLKGLAGLASDGAVTVAVSGDDLLIDGDRQDVSDSREARESGALLHARAVAAVLRGRVPTRRYPIGVFELQQSTLADAPSVIVEASAALRRGTRRSNDLSSPAPVSRRTRAEGRLRAPGVLREHRGLAGGRAFDVPLFRPERSPGILYIHPPRPQAPPRRCQPHGRRL